MDVLHMLTSFLFKGFPNRSKSTLTKDKRNILFRNVMITWEDGSNS